jgi:hypothetical protein
MNNLAFSHHHHQHTLSPQQALLSSSTLKLQQISKMQFSTILSLLAVAGMAVAAPSVASTSPKPHRVTHPTNEPGRQSNENGLASVNLEDTNVPVTVDVPIKGNNVANGVANDVLEDGVNVEHVAHDINAPVGAGVLGNVNQVAPKGGLPPF